MLGTATSTVGSVPHVLDGPETTPSRSSRQNRNPQTLLYPLPQLGSKRGHAGFNLGTMLSECKGREARLFRMLLLPSGFRVWGLSKRM